MEFVSQGNDEAGVRGSKALGERLPGLGVDFIEHECEAYADVRRLAHEPFVGIASIVWPPRL